MAITARVMHPHRFMPSLVILVATLKRIAYAAIVPTILRQAPISITMAIVIPAHNNLNL